MEKRGRGTTGGRRLRGEEGWQRTRAAGGETVVQGLCGEWESGDGREERQDGRERGEGGQGTGVRDGRGGGKG